MQAKDKFLEKINLLILVFVLCFSHILNAEDVYGKLFNYNNTLKNTSAHFIQTDLNDLQDGKIFFGNNRIKIIYNNPTNLTIILSEKKGMYVNHELKETEFFITKKSYIKIFFDIFHKKKRLQNMTIKESNGQIEISQKTKIDNISYNISLIYENDPLKLRRLEIVGNDEKIQMGFFDHKIEEFLNKSFFSMVDPYLN